MKNRSEEKFEIGLQNIQKGPCFAYAEVNGKVFLASEEAIASLL